MEQSRTDYKALQEEGERRERELTQVQLDARHGTQSSAKSAREHRADTVTFKVPHLRLSSPGSTVRLIYCGCVGGCIQAMRTSAVAAPTWMK